MRCFQFLVTVIKTAKTICVPVWGANGGFRFPRASTQGAGRLAGAVSVGLTLWETAKPRKLFFFVCFYNLYIFVLTPTVWGRCSRCPALQARALAPPPGQAACPGRTPALRQIWGAWPQPSGPMPLRLAHWRLSLSRCCLPPPSLLTRAGPAPPSSGPLSVSVPTSRAPVGPLSPPGLDLACCRGPRTREPQACRAPTRGPPRFCQSEPPENASGEVTPSLLFLWKMAR